MSGFILGLVQSRSGSYEESRWNLLHVSLKKGQNKIVCLELTHLVYTVGIPIRSITIDKKKINDLRLFRDTDLMFYT